MGNWSKSRQIDSLDSLEDLARELAQLFKPAMSIGFVGQLGAGKTTLIRFIVQQWGVVGSVSSPTFVLSHEYQTKVGLVEHWDLYRVNTIPDELLEMPTDNIRLVEWPDKFPEYLASLDKICKISLIEEGNLIRRNFELFEADDLQQFKS